MYKVKNEYMNMAGFQNTDYGARTNRSYQSTRSYKNNPQMSGKTQQVSFSQRVTANLKLDFEKYYSDVTEKFQAEEPKTGVFSNKTLAEAAGFKLDYDINRESAGTGVLTEEQIQYLKDKYDVENLTETDYYNLLAELTQMNVLSGEDVERQFVHKSPCTAMITPAYQDWDTDEGDEGNYLRKLQRELEETEILLSMLKAGKCSVSPESSLESVRAFYEEQQEYNKKVADIFRQLQRGTSKAVFSAEKMES